MAYDKQTWTDNETLINAERMNHIEDGIESAQSAADEAVATAQDAYKVAGQAEVEAGAAERMAEEAQAAIPTKVSELDNDVPYATKEELDAQGDSFDSAFTPLAEQVEYVGNMAQAAQQTANEVKNTAITAITLNGESVPVENNTAEISAIAAMQVEGESDETIGARGTLADMATGFEVPGTPLAAIVRMHGAELIGTAVELSDVEVSFVIFNMADYDLTVGTYAVTIFYMG